MSTDKTPTDQQQQINEGFISFIVKLKRYPFSSKELAKFIGINEVVLKQHVSSFFRLEQAIWLSWQEETITIMEGDENFIHLSAPEKLLAYYFTFFDTIKGQRDYIQIRLNPFFPVPPVFPFWSRLKTYFSIWVKQLVMEGKEQEIIAKRMIVPDKIYEELFFAQWVFLVNFWAKDKSNAQEKSDAAVEKSTALLFELLQQNIFDAFFDFGKFLSQQINTGGAKS